MFNIAPITNESAISRLKSLNKNDKTLVIPMAELIRTMPDPLNEYVVEQIQNTKGEEGSWNGLLATVQLKQVHHVDKKVILLNGIICVDELNPRAESFWFDSQTQDIVEIQFYKTITKNELVILLLEEKGNGHDSLKKLLDPNYVAETP
jgi:hypothetical protein